MNILLITYDFYPNVGGVAYSLWNIYNQLKSKGHNIYVFNSFMQGENIFKTITPANPSIKKMLSVFLKKEFYFYTLYSFWIIIKDKKIPVSHKIRQIVYLLIKLRTLTWIVENLIQIIPYLKKLKFDFIYGGNSRWCLPLVYIISKIFKKKLVSMAYGSDFLIGNPLHLKSYYYKHLDKVMVICNQMKNLIRKTHGLDENQVEIVNVGVNIKDLELRGKKSEIRQELNIPENQFVLLSVGRHNYRKNFKTVIKAIKEIKKIRPLLDIKYFLIGKGRETKKLKELSKKFNLEKNIEFLGLCDIETRNKFYKSSDIFVMPSISTKDNVEGFGIVFLEANYYKVPVIGSKMGGIADAIVEGETGLFVNPNDVNDLVEKILFLFDNEDKRKKIGENGYKRVINDFTWDKIILDYIKIFQGLK